MPPLTLYPCPQPRCHTFTSTLPSALIHYTTSHHASALPVTSLFGRHGLRTLHSPLTLRPSLSANPTYHICFRCACIFDTPDDVETHLLETPLHNVDAADAIREYGPPGLTRLVAGMSVVEAMEGGVRSVAPAAGGAVGAVVVAAPAAADGLGVVNNQHNYVYADNRELPPAAAPIAPQLHIHIHIHKPPHSTALRLPPATTFTGFLGHLVTAAPAVDWRALTATAGGVTVEYQSVKMRGGRARWVVRNERGWVRLVGDVVPRGGVVAWFV